MTNLKIGVCINLVDQGLEQKVQEVQIASFRAGIRQFGLISLLKKSKKFFKVIILQLRHFGAVGKARRFGTFMKGQKHWGYCRKHIAMHE